MVRTHYWRSVWGGLLVCVGACHHEPAHVTVMEQHSVAPSSQPTATQALALDASWVGPMYREKLAIDLPTVVRVAAARNIDIQQARERVKASQGMLESVVGTVFPALAPTAAFEHVDGTVRATEGALVGVGFNTFQPSIAVQWALNPGRVIFEIVAAKKRLLASEQQERAAVMETLRTAAVEFYTLVLAQSRVSTAYQAVSESRELLRINQLRTQTGTGVPADELRAQARLAERQQDLALAVQAFYQASVTLAVTLHLDVASTLIPKLDELPPIRLIRTDLSLDEMMAAAVANRPDLAGVRTLTEAVAAQRGATWWGAFGPQFEVGYQYGGITGNADNVDQGEGIPSNLIVNPLSPTGSFNANPVVNGLTREGIARGSRRAAKNRDRTFGFTDQQRFGAKVGWRLSLSAFGDLKTASAKERQAILEADRRLDEVKAEVVRAAQASKTHEELIDIARQQVTSAEEALRLSQANLQAGTMTTLDVMQAQDAVSHARLRYAEVVVRYNQSQVNLLAAIGMLSSETLAEPANEDGAANSISTSNEAIKPEGNAGDSEQTSE